MKLDLKEWIAKVTGQTEFKTLLWTNPSPTSAMGAVTLVPSGADVYDDIEVIYKTAHIYNGYWTSRGPFSAGTYITMSATAGTGGEFSGAIYAGVRTISMFAGGKLQADGAIGMSSSGTVSNNNMCIPVKIYGIRYVGGVVRRLFNSFTLGRGWAV